MRHELHRAITDSRCRFLCERPSGEREFSRLLKALGLELPHFTNLHQLAQAGLLIPVLRVQLPEPFIREWRNFPLIPRLGSFRAEDAWATRLWDYSATSAVENRLHLGGLSADWQRHWLERLDDEVSRAAFAHRISPVSTPVPASVDHPRRSTPIHPWLDYYSYVQVYRLASLLSISILPGLPLLPGWQETLGEILRDIDDRAATADAHRVWEERYWAESAKTLDWISRYRTIRGLWSAAIAPRRPPNAREKLKEATEAMLVSEGLGRADIDEGIDTITEVADRWKRSGVGSLLRQDLDRAVELRALLYGRPHKEVDRGRLRNLLRSLPAESLSAELLFPSTCFHYLGTLRTVDPALDVESLARIVEIWWPSSVAFRRLALSLERLHRHFSGAVNEDLVSLVSETPEDFLTLFGLAAEQLFAECSGRREPTSIWFAQLQ